MPKLTEIDLVPASVPQTATFLEAAEALVSHSVTTIAVLDGNGRVVGLFGDDDLLGGVFPRYLRELRHTAFASDDEALLAERTRQVAAEPVERHMHEAITLDADTSALHAAERFLHSEFTALPVIERGRFVGMLGQAELCRAVLGKAEREGEQPA